MAQKSPAIALDTIKEFYPDSTLSRVYTVQKGTDIREGASLSYHPNGKLAIEAPYKAGKLDGVFRSSGRRSGTRTALKKVSVPTTTKTARRSPAKSTRTVS